MKILVTLSKIFVYFIPLIFKNRMHLASSSQSTNFTANDEYQTQKLNEENENLRGITYYIIYKYFMNFHVFIITI